MNTREVAIGSISHGTMRTQDVIPAMCHTLEYYGAKLPEDLNWHAKNWKIAQKFDDLPYWESENAGYDWESLSDALNEIAPPFCYFGCTEGDGSDYGFWPENGGIEMAIRDEEVLDYDNLPEYVAQVNDHGNVTLYTVELKEVWSIV